MKTAITEILEHCKFLLSKGQQVDTQGLVEWIENSLLSTEEEQIIKAYKSKLERGTDSKWQSLIQEQAEQYYNETYGDTEETKKG